MARGKVLQYSNNDGKGIIVVAGVQYPFTISQWSGDEAPMINRVIEADVDGSNLVRLSVVPEAILLKEKSEHVKQALGVVGGKIGEQGKQFSQNVISVVGSTTLIAYVVFFLASTLLTFATVHFIGSQGITLYGAAAGFDRDKNTDFKIFLYITYLSFLLPVFIRDARSWLSLLIPLIFLLAVGWEAYSQVSTAMDTARGVANGMAAFLGGSDAQQRLNQQLPQINFSDVYSIGVGCYVTGASALFLALTAVRKYIVRS